MNEGERTGEDRRRKSLGTNAAAARAPALPSLAHAILSTRCPRDGYDNGRPRSARTRASSFTPGTANGRCIFQRRTDRNFSHRSTDARGSFPILFLLVFSPFFLSFCCCFLSSLCHDGYSIRDVRVFALHPPASSVFLHPRSRRELLACVRSGKTLIFSHAFHVSLSPFRRLKLECDKLASEKMEIQRHYVMVSAIATS